MAITKSSDPFVLNLGDFAEAAECLRTIAHPARLRILQLVAKKARSVGDLAEACDLRSHETSGHLRLLKDRGLLDSERRGRNVYYRLSEPAVRGILRCVEHRFGGRAQWGKR